MKVKRGELVRFYVVNAGPTIESAFRANLRGTYPAVNHAFGHGEKGAIGAIVVEA
jgi:hypothetical protein